MLSAMMLPLALAQQQFGRQSTERVRMAVAAAAGGTQKKHESEAREGADDAAERPAQCPGR